MRKWTGCDWQRRRTQPERSDFKIVRWITWEVWWGLRGWTHQYLQMDWQMLRERTLFWNWGKDGVDLFSQREWGNCERVAVLECHMFYCQKRDHYQARTKQLWTWQVMMRWRIYELQRKSGKFPQRGNHLPTIVNCLLGVCVFLCLHLHLDISLATLILFCSDRGLSPRCADEIEFLFLFLISYLFIVFQISNQNITDLFDNVELIGVHWPNVSINVYLIARNMLMLKVIRTRRGRRQVKVSRNQFM